MTSKMFRIEVSCNAEREVGKAFINMFYLTLIAVFVTSPLTGNKFFSIFHPVFYVLLAFFFIALGIFLISHADKREERKAKNAMQTEIKKGIFHIQNAELNSK